MTGPQYQMIEHTALWPLPRRNGKRCYGSGAVIFGLAELVRFAPDRDINSDVVDVGFVAP
jgi:hypothetical protein